MLLTLQEFFIDIFYFSYFACYLHNLRSKVSLYYFYFSHFTYYFLLCHNLSIWRCIQNPVEPLGWRNFAKLVSNFWPLTFSHKNFIVVVRQGSQYASGCYVSLTNHSSSFYTSLYLITRCLQVSSAEVFFLCSID